MKTPFGFSIERSEPENLTSLKIAMLQQGIDTHRLAALSGVHVRTLQNVLSGTNTCWPPREKINLALGHQFFKPRTPRRPQYKKLPLYALLQKHERAISRKKNTAALEARLEAALARVRTAALQAIETERVELMAALARALEPIMAMSADYPVMRDVLAALHPPAIDEIKHMQNLLAAPAADEQRPIVERVRAFLEATERAREFAEQSDFIGRRIFTPRPLE